ncbi:MAG: type II toxin-antitoxin system PrlF family antitoxin [Pseudomonas sp.]|uniref:type II toxin-antitoxin system PrlF family antitoxin n=1 Tax=Pseudomonas sp. TaxID=306 RepID=UPI003D6F2C26
MGRTSRSCCNGELQIGLGHEWSRIPSITSVNRVQSKEPLRTEPKEADPSVSRTLERLAVDMNANPERILPVHMRLGVRIISLVGQIDVDLNTQLSAEDE